MKRNLIGSSIFILILLFLCNCGNEDKNNKDNVYLLYKGKNSSYPCFFPDGQNIAFAEYETTLGNDNISENKSWVSIIDKNGGNYKMLDMGGITFRYIDRIDISPDGKWIVFTGYESGNDNSDIYVMSPDGKNISRIYIEGNEICPRFGNDDEWIYFFRFTDYENGIWKVKRSGYELTETSKRGGYSCDFTLSQDNNYIVYGYIIPNDIEENVNGIDVYSFIDEDSWNIFEKTMSNQYLPNPCLSPDGEWICYNFCIGENIYYSNLYIVNFNGGESKNITSVNSIMPDWSPDSKWIVFIGDDDGIYKLKVPSEFLPE